MPELTELQVDEISLVDSPANSEIDPKTGRKVKRAVVALWKRDRDDTEPATTEQLLQRKEEMARLRITKLEGRIAALDTEIKTLAASRDPKENMIVSKLQEVLKSGTSTADQIADALELEAQVVAKSQNIRISKARQLVVEQNVDAHQAYETAKRVELAKGVSVAKAEPRTVMVTKAESMLDARARKMVKRLGVSYAKACSMALEQDPGLYEQYLQESSANERSIAPVEYESVPTSYAKQHTAGATDGECPNCGEPIDDGDKFCAACGRKIAASK